MSIEHKLDGIVDALAGLSLALRRPGDQYANVNETPVADGINNANQGLVNQQRWSPTVRTNPIQEAGTLFHNVSPSHLPYHQIRGSPPVYPIHTGAHYRPGLQSGHRGSPPGIMHPSPGQRPSITPGRSRTMDYNLHNAHPAGRHVPQHEPNPTAPVVGHRAAYPIVGCCYGCGCTPCAYPVSDDRLQKEMKTVKALKKPEQGKFLGMVDKRSGLGFRLEVIRNCGRLSPIVVHHYLREHVCMDVHKSIGIGDDWPLNCDADYSNSVNVIWDRLTTVYSGQSTSEKLLDSWSHLRQGDGEPVQKYVNRVCNAQEELSLAGNGRSESEIRAKLRCGLRDQRLQSDMLQYNNAPLPDFIAIMSQKVIDYDRQAGQCFSNGGAPYGQSSQFQLGWANPASDGASTSLASAGAPSDLTGKLDEILLNGVQAGPLPDGSIGCARGCKDSACKGVRTCLLAKPNLPSGVCPFCARSHGGTRETDCAAFRKVCARCNKVGHFGAACRSAPVKNGRRPGKGEGKGKSKNGVKGEKKTDSAVESSSSSSSSPNVTIDGLIGPEESLPEIYSLETSICNAGVQSANGLRGVKVQSAIPAQLLTRDPDGNLKSSAKVLIRTLWDSGASGNFLRYDAVERILGRPPVCGTPTTSATLADGSSIQAVGICRLKLHTPKCTATVVAFVVKELTTPLVLGTPGLRALGARLDFLENGTVSISTGNKTSSSSTSDATTREPCPVASITVQSDVDECLTSTGSSLNFIDLLTADDPVQEQPRKESYPVSKRPPVVPVGGGLPAHKCIHIDVLRDGRYAVNFGLCQEGLKDFSGRGWKAAVARAAKASNRLSPDKQRQVEEAISRLLASGYVAFMTLKDTSRPPPPRVINNLYCGNALVKDSYVTADTHLRERLPSFIGAQFVFKDSPTTPCRIVYDCRPTNGALVTPTVTRWCLHKYLLGCSTHPAVTFLDIRQAYNQLVMTPTSSATCCTVLQPPSTPSRPRPRPILVIWVTVAFGLAPSGGALELATAHVALEAEEVLSLLQPPPTQDYDPLKECPALPSIYHSADYDYARPALEACFSKVHNAQEVQLLRKLSSELSWRDYVDDWVVMGHHFLQAVHGRRVLSSCANSHKFTFPLSKCHESWALEAASAATVVGYILTQDDCLRPKISVEPLCSTATKRMASQVLAGLYDPLGKFLEANMHARLIWRKAVLSVKESAPGEPSAASWDRQLSPQVIDEVNDWITQLHKLQPVPRYVPVRPGPLLESNAEFNHACEILISCDASGVAWCVETRSRLNCLPVSPRLRARGGLFPQTTAGSDYALTTPRKELHALYQACREAYSLYLSCNLAPSMGSRITVLTDSLINLQRLQWIGTKNEEEVLSGLRRRHMTVHDVDKLLSIRELLLRVTLPIKVVHIPSEVNLADPGSRCKPYGPDDSVLKLLASILDSPNQRPTYVPVSLSTTTSGKEEDLPAGSHLCPLSPRAGPLPVPLPEDPSQQVPRLSDEDTQALDSLINESVKQDRIFEAIRLFLSSGTVSPPFSRERLRRASAQYEVDQNGTLYRTVLQRADGSIVKQRVVGEDRALLLKLVGSIHINHHHLGARQLMLKVKEEYHFKNLPSVVRRCVRLCRPCSRANAVRRFNSSAGAHNVQDLKPLQVIGVDIYLPNLKDPSEKVYQKEYSGCLVVTCLATSFQRVHLLKGSVTTKSVCEGLTSLFNNSIWPSVLVSDNASCFSSKEMLRWCKLRGLVHLFSPPYAAALSRWERSHREITRCLRCCACDTHFFGGKPWFDIVSDVVSNLNHLPYSEDCWITPAMLCFGFFDPGDFYRPTASLDQLAERLVAN